MRTITKIITTLTIIGGGTWGFYQWQKGEKSARETKIAAIQTATIRDVAKKKVISGRLIPEKEIRIASHLTGIIDKLYVNVGDHVQQGAPIARIKKRPKSEEVAQAKKKVRLAQIALKEAEAKYVRNKQLLSKGIISKAEYEPLRSACKTARENIAAAKRELEIAAQGYATDTEDNIIYATTKGIILALPLEEGNNVVESSNTKERDRGDIIAEIADMDKFLFKFRINEMDILHIKKGMQFEGKLNANPNKKFTIIITKIAPKANLEEVKRGNIQFDVEGRVVPKENSKLELRSGYIAIADIILESAKNVLAIQEKWLHTEGREDFVWIKGVTGKKEKKIIKRGISDGIYVEIKEGITATDQIITEDDSN